MFVGDYVDRGPDSKGVVDLLLSLADDYACVFLAGNHESMFLDFLGWRGEAYFAGDAFLTNGGDRTLASYGYFERPIRRRTTSCCRPRTRSSIASRPVSPRGRLPLRARGARARGPARARPRATRCATRSLKTCSGTAPRSSVPHTLGVTVVYGHTPTPDFEVRWHRPFSIGIDTGAVYGGRLTAIRLPDETVFQV